MKNPPGRQLTRLFEEMMRDSSNDGDRVLTRAQVDEYSLVDHLRGLCGMSGRDPFASRVGAELNSRSSPRLDCTSNLIPSDVLASHGGFTRDMYSGEAGAGGALVGQEIWNPIDLLRNKMVTARLGANWIDGLKENVFVPIGSAAPQVTFVSEIGQGQLSQPVVSGLRATPHRVTVGVKVNQQFLIQGGALAERFLRKSFFDSIYQVVEFAALNGTGNPNQPTGLIETAGITSTIFGGAPTWQAVNNFEQQITLADADQDDARIAYLCDPATRNLFKNTPVTAPGATAVTQKFLWEDFDYRDGTNDGRCNGYRIASTRNVINSVLMYGAWNNLYILLWGDGIDITADKFSYASQADVEFWLHAWCDVYVAHPQSFVISADSAAQ